MTQIELSEDASLVDAALAEIPDVHAVFLLWPREGKPYLARTNVLRRRLLRLLATRERPGKNLNLRGTIRRVEYQPVGSKLEGHFLLRDLARRYLGPGYREEIRLRLPPYVKLILTNTFPRTCVTATIGRAPAVYYGPFRNRATAARFESEFLDLFQLRRCQEDLAPSPEHPGCIYGEMGRCLRPCQQAVGTAEYAGEAARVREFLDTGGASLVRLATSARERLSTEMDFEGAAMMHQRCERIGAVLGMRDEMARSIAHLHAIAVVRSAAAEAVELGWLREGSWQGFTRIETGAQGATAVSLDARLREMALAVPANAATGTERMEHLAIVARWFYSTWRDGELLLVDDWAKIPYRKLVNAVSRVAQGPAPHRQSSHS